MTDFGSAGWRAAGACVSADPDLFFPVSDQGEGAAQAARACRICAGCPVRRQCLEFALRTSQTEGIWGGTTPAERSRARRAAAEARRRARRRSVAGAGAASPGAISRREAPALPG